MLRFSQNEVSGSVFFLQILLKLSSLGLGFANKGLEVSESRQVSDFTIRHP